jgi:hypothetical protein
MMEENIYTKINQIKEMFLGIIPDAKNDFSNYTYLTLAAINKILIPAERKAGLYHRITFEEGRAKLEIINIEKLHEIVSVEKRMGTASLKACHDAQNEGAAESYARRYLLMAAFDIACEDELDSGYFGDPEQPGKPPAGRPQGNRPGPQKPPQKPPQNQPRNQGQRPPQAPPQPPRNQPQNQEKQDPHYPPEQTEYEKLKKAVWAEIKNLPAEEQEDWISAARDSDADGLQTLLDNLLLNAKSRSGRSSKQNTLSEQWGPYPGHNPER